MIDQPKKMTIIVRFACLGAVAGCLIWLSLLMYQSAMMRSKQQKVAAVQAGPLVLNTIERHPHGNTATINVIFNAGMLVYFTSWLLLGFGCGVIATKQLLKE
jgi:hypothetical protein